MKRACIVLGLMLGLFILNLAGGVLESRHARRGPRRQATPTQGLMEGQP